MIHFNRFMKNKLIYSYDITIPPLPTFISRPAKKDSAGCECRNFALECVVRGCIEEKVNGSYN